MTTIRWGVIGTGWISELFATDLIRFSAQNNSAIKHVITVVGSSQREKAEKFVAEKLQPLIDQLGLVYRPIEAVEYDDAYSSDDVDIVYIGSPHVNHMDNSLQAISHGKSVLCEKPVTVNSAQLERVLAAAEEKKVFFMEALWVRFFPANRELVERIYGPEKVLGDVKRVTAKYSTKDVRTNKAVTPAHRLVCKALGGGATLDIGVYPLTYLRLYLDPALDPAKWELTSSKLGMDNMSGNEADNVDFSAEGVIVVPGSDQQGEFYYSFFGDTDPYELCVIEGTKGVARLKHAEFPSTWEYTLEIDGEKEVKRFDNAVPDSTGFYFQIQAVGEALAKGERETRIAPWADSRAEMALTDRIRAASGFTYAEDETQ